VPPAELAGKATGVAAPAAAARMAALGIVSMMMHKNLDRVSIYRI
jgi:hypothetical protein